MCLARVEHSVGDERVVQARLARRTPFHVPGHRLETMRELQSVHTFMKPKKAKRCTENRSLLGTSR